LKNQVLNNELPIVHEQRAAFVYPCLEAFIEAQVRNSFIQSSICPFVLGSLLRST